MIYFTYLNVPAHGAYMFYLFTKTRTKRVAVSSFNVFFITIGSEAHSMCKANGSGGLAC